MTGGVRVGQAHLEKGTLQAFLQDSYKYGGDRLLHSCQYLSKQVEKVKQSHKHSELCSDVFFLHVYIALQLCFAHNNTYSLHSCILHISSLSMKMGFATSLMVI